MLLTGLADAAELARKDCDDSEVMGLTDAAELAREDSNDSEVPGVSGLSGRTCTVCGARIVCGFNTRVMKYVSAFLRGMRRPWVSVSPGSPSMRRTIMYPMFGLIIFVLNSSMTLWPALFMSVSVLTVSLGMI